MLEGSSEGVVLNASDPDNADDGSIHYLKGAVFGVSAVVIWAGWMAITRIGVTTTLDVFDITALRFLVAGLVLLPIIWKSGWKLDRLGFPRLVLLISGAGAPYVLIASQGLSYAPVADAGALIPGVMPLFVAVLAASLLGEKLSRLRKIGLGLVLVGVLAITGESLAAGIGIRSVGHVLFLSGAFLWACYTVTMRWSKIKPLHATAIVSVGSMVGYLPGYLAFAGLRVLDAPVADVLMQAIFQGLLVTVIALTLFGKAVEILGAASGATFAALVPVVATIIAVPLLGEIPSMIAWASIVLISFGVYLASGGRVRRYKDK